MPANPDSLHDLAVKTRDTLKALPGLPGPDAALKVIPIAWEFVCRFLQEGGCGDLSCDLREGHEGLHQDPAGRQWARWTTATMSQHAVALCRTCAAETTNLERPDRMPMECGGCGDTRITVLWRPGKSAPRVDDTVRVFDMAQACLDPDAVASVLQEYWKAKSPVVEWHSCPTALDEFANSLRRNAGKPITWQTVFGKIVLHCDLAEAVDPLDREVELMDSAGELVGRIINFCSTRTDDAAPAPAP